MAEDAARAANEPAVEDDRAVSRVRRPGPALDAAPGVDRGQLELGAIRGTVEHRRPIGRRLGQDEGDIDRGVRARPEPRPRGDLLGARLVSCPQPPEPVDGERRIEPQRPCREPRTVAARHTCPGERPRCSPPRLVAPVAALEPLDEPPEGVRRGRRGPVGQGKTCACEPRELRIRLVEIRSESRNLPERDPALALALEPSPSRGRLRLMPAVEDERVMDVVPVGDVEQSGPEVVVLAFRERRVVAEAVLVKHGPVEDDRRVEERRREQGRPPHGARVAGHAVDRTEAPVSVEIDRP